VVSMDEKPVVFHPDVFPPQPMRPGRVARRDGEYQRCSTANLFCRVEPKAGQYFPKVTHGRPSFAFAGYLLDIAVCYLQSDTIRLILDNLNSHTRTAVEERLGKKAGGRLWNRFTMHYTPKHGSWLKRAGIAMSLFLRQCPIDPLGERKLGLRVSYGPAIVSRFNGTFLAKKHVRHLTTESRSHSTWLSLCKFNKRGRVQLIH
jgi:hypothetical protein